MARPSVEACARCRREGVIDEDVAIGGKCCCEFRRVLLFALVERVFSRSRISPFCMSSVADFATSPMQSDAKRTRRSSTAFNRRRDRLQRHVGNNLTLRTAEMGQQDDLRALVGEFEDGRRNTLDARRIRHLAVADRHVEIDAHQHALAAISLRSSRVLKVMAGPRIAIDEGRKAPLSGSDRTIHASVQETRGEINAGGVFISRIEGNTPAQSAASAERAPCCRAPVERSPKGDQRVNAKHCATNKEECDPRQPMVLYDPGRLQK